MSSGGTLFANMAMPPGLEPLNPLNPYKSYYGGGAAYIPPAPLTSPPPSFASLYRAVADNDKPGAEAEPTDAGSGGGGSSGSGNEKELHRAYGYGASGGSDSDGDYGDDDDDGDDDEGRDDKKRGHGEQPIEILSDDSSSSDDEEEEQQQQQQQQQPPPRKKQKTTATKVASPKGKGKAKATAKKGKPVAKKSKKVKFAKEAKKYAHASPSSPSEDDEDEEEEYGGNKKPKQRYFGVFKESRQDIRLFEQPATFRPGQPEPVPALDRVSPWGERWWANQPASFGFGGETIFARAWHSAEMTRSLSRDERGRRRKTQPPEVFPRTSRFSLPEPEDMPAMTAEREADLEAMGVWELNRDIVPEFFQERATLESVFPVHADCNLPEQDV